MDGLSLIQDQGNRSREEQSQASNKRSFRDNTDSLHKKQRSHSRGNSIANLAEILGSTSMIPSPPRSRPSSHHQRQSSLSSRRASAEIMGITLPDDDKSSAPDDSLLYALLALEGKNSSPLTPSFGFSKVDLPDLSVAAAELKLDLGAAPGTGTPRTSSNNSLTGKRDSFGKLLTPASSCSSKKELHTLLEEDEGDDEEPTRDEPQYVPPAPSPHPQRHRPASLKLRPLSLRSAAALPTPSPTPPMRNSTKLKSLTLSSPSVVPATALGPPKRSSAVVTGGSPMLSTIELDTSLQRSNSVGLGKQDSAPLTRPGFLTPDASSSLLARSPSPYFSAQRRSPSPGRSPASSPDDVYNTYLAQSHTSLLVRIAELENALTIRDHISTPALAEPSEELLEMLTDLKTERDNLKKELDEARVKTAEDGKQVVILNRRIDNERREVWVTKEKLSIAEAASTVIEEERDELRAKVKQLNDIASALKDDLLRERKEKAKLEAELRELQRTPKVTDLTIRVPKATNNSQVTNFNTPSQDTKLEGADIDTIYEEGEHDYSGSYPDSHTSFFDVCPATSACATKAPTYQPYQIPRRRTSLDNGWSFSNATSAPRKREPAKEVDLFFTCLENLDRDQPGYAKPLVEVQTLKRQPKVLGLGFGFDLLEDEDPDFNFGQPVGDKPFSFHQQKPEESQGDVTFVTPTDTDEEEASRPPAPLPFLDDEDSAFSFGASQDSSITSRSTSPDLELAGLITPRLTPPRQLSAPDVFSATASAKRQHNRSCSRISNESVDLSSTSWTFPKSAPPNITTFSRSKPQAPPSVLAPVQMVSTITRAVVPMAPAAKASSPASSPKKTFTFGRTTVPIPTAPSRVGAKPSPRPLVMLSPLGRTSPSQRPYCQEAQSQPSTPTSKSTQTPKSSLFANLASLLPSWSPKSQREQPSLLSPLASPSRSSHWNL